MDSSLKTVACAIAFFASLCQTKTDRLGRLQSEKGEEERKKVGQQNDYSSFLTLGQGYIAMTGSKYLYLMCTKKGEKEQIKLEHFACKVAVQGLECSSDTAAGGCNGPEFAQILSGVLSAGMVHGWSRQRAQLVIKMIVAASLTGLCMFILGQSSAGGPLDMVPLTSPSSVQSALYFSNWDSGSLGANTFSRPRANWFSTKEDGVSHVMVTGGAGYIGSHAALRLLQDGYRVTIIDNLSRGNMGAVDVLRALFPKPGHLQFLYVDLGDSHAVHKVFARNAIDAVMHFAAVAYVGESMAEPLRYYHNITSNTLGLLEAMVKHDVKTLIYSSTCATYGEPETMPITETTPQVPINPYGKAKKMAEDIILDYSKINPELSVMILRYFNVIGSDPKGRLGEAPRPELRAHGRISGACFDAAMGQIPGLKVHGQDYETEDGTCIRDYIHVTDLVDAHVKALKHAKPNNVSIYNVGTGKGRSVKEFVEACIKATGVNMTVSYLERRPGDYAVVYSDSSKIQHELNWTAQHLDLTETLNIAWKWHQAHPTGY